MKYSKTAIGLLTAQYRSVLKKCLMINLGLFALGAVATATPAQAANEFTSDLFVLDSDINMNVGNKGWINFQGSDAGGIKIKTLSGGDVVSRFVLGVDGTVTMDDTIKNNFLTALGIDGGGSGGGSGTTYVEGDGIAFNVVDPDGNPNQTTISVKLQANSYLTKSGYGLAVDTPALQAALTGEITAGTTGAGFVTGNAINTKLQDYATTTALNDKLTGVAATSITSTDTGFATAAQVANAISTAGAEYVTAVAESAATADDGTFAVTKNGTTTNVAVKGWANKADASTVTDLVGSVSDLSDAVDANTGKLTTLEGSATTAGSIDYKIANATIAQSQVTGLDDALDGKVNAVEGKGLSTNDLTNELKNTYDGYATAIAGKV
ncbi:MAG: hypothetical protein IKR92_03255, partial [Alphaproteobacteria bacterium]|nr:hypothetical protein [Alphaproteobacteria bacterium]